MKPGTDAKACRVDAGVYDLIGSASAHHVRDNAVDLLTFTTGVE
jgi:hypothetical protein